MARQRTDSALERRFDLTWGAVGGFALEPEIRVHASRRFRFDRASTAHMVAFEIEGGTWVGGRHTRGAGFARDCEKSNLAQLVGWRVYRLTTDMISVRYLSWLLKGIRAGRVDGTQLGT